ncbi:MAG: Thioredoxin-dependent thiol peroxidase [Promethearchaeota archaeon]|nr:MAG: Thioredoxin-dependent thiol peroxidase [Candidatus Lokiarchaeota archaeon]
MEDFQKRNVKLISISTDSVNHLKDFKEENNLKMSLVSDRGAKIGKRYDVDIFDTGAGKDIKFKQEIPSKYLINSSGIIVWKYIGKDKTDRPSMKQILGALDEKL